MTLLVIGLLLWTAAHMVKPAAPGARGALAERLGAGPARGVMALLIAAGLVLMIVGFRRAAVVPVYDPPAWAVHVNNLLMFFAVALMGAGRSKGHARSWLRNPMLTGVVVWAIAHLLVNGDQASLVLFGWLGLWAVASIVLIDTRQPAWVRPEPGPISGDIRLLVITVVIYGVIIAVHTWLGYPPFPALSAQVPKTRTGRFFEDYRVGQTLAHAVPRTLGEGERALYLALYPSRFALASSDEFARACGLPRSPFDALAVFHTVFGKTVPDVSLNAVANLGYAEGRFLMPVYPGDTLTAASEVIGLRETSNGRAGVVWVRTVGRNQHGQAVLSYCRWVMVHKREAGVPAPEPVVPVLAPAVAAEDLAVPAGLDFAAYDFALAGEPHRWGDYAVGDRIDHVDRVTIEEAEHMLATRLWQNTARLHFDATRREDGRRLIYGGHVVSLARALSFNGLANAQAIAAINAGAHANPCFAGDTVGAWSEVLDRAGTAAPGVGALRIRTVATRAGAADFALRDPEGKYLPDVLLDLDYWVFVPA